MKKAQIKVHNKLAGILTETDDRQYHFQYLSEYDGPPISLTLPVREEVYNFDSFPPYFDGVLPEGIQLEGLLKQHKVDGEDYFAQLVLTGADLVGAVTVEELEESNE